MNFWVYVLSWCGLGVVLLSVFRLLIDKSPVTALVISMVVSFICVYMIANFIEYGALNFSDGVRWLVGISTLALGAGVVGLPFYFLDCLAEGAFMECFFNMLAIYVIVPVSVIVLLTLLSWINDTSPWKEFGKSIKLPR